MAQHPSPITVGVLALQGAYREHISLLTTAAAALPSHTFTFTAVRTPADLAACQALIIPGGESTTISLIAQRSNLLEPLRNFVKLEKRPTWGTCAGMILLAEAANRTKAGGQELIGGLSVRVNRNHFGRQVESFQAQLDMACLEEGGSFNGVFIRAPIVESVLGGDGAGAGDSAVVVDPSPGTEVAPELGKAGKRERVEVLARLERALLPVEGLGRSDRRLSETTGEAGETDELREKEKVSAASEIVAVRQGNVVGTSFHPELTADARMHVWWLKRVVEDLEKRRG